MYEGERGLGKSYEMRITGGGGSKPQNSVLIFVNVPKEQKSENLIVFQKTAVLSLGSWSQRHFMVTRYYQPKNR